MYILVLVNLPQIVIRILHSFEEHKLSKSNKNYFLTGRVIENIDIFSLNAEIVDYEIALVGLSFSARS